MAVGNVAALAVKIFGDSKSGQQAMVDMALSTDKASKAVKGASGVMMGAWAAAAAAAALCVKEASALEQAGSAVSQVFGEMAPQVMTWAEDMSAYGLSTAQAAQAAAVLGGAIKSAGIDMEYVAILSTKLIEISMDLVATFGYSVPQALSAMAAALRAEYDPLEKFGIYLTADMVAAEATRLSMEGLTFESERQAKMIATLSLIYQQSIPYMDAAENMQDNMKLTTMRLVAETKNLASTIGGALIPILQPMVDAVGKAVGALNDQVKESELLADTSGILKDILEDVGRILETVFVPMFELAWEVLEELWNLLEPIVIPVLETLERVLSKVADALEVVCGWVEKAIGWFDDFTDSVHDAIDALTFWNDTYDPNADNAPPAAVKASKAKGGKKSSSSKAGITININTEGMTDPYALARLVTRSLEDYAHVQGRKAGQPLAGAW